MYNGYFDGLAKPWTHKRNKVVDNTRTTIVVCNQQGVVVPASITITITTATATATATATGRAARASSIHSSH